MLPCWHWCAGPSDTVQCYIQATKFKVQTSVNYGVYTAYMFSSCKALEFAINSLHNRDFNDAVSYLDMAELLQPGDTIHLQLRGLAKALMKDYKGALQDLEGRADTEDLLAACAECHIKLGTYKTFKVSCSVLGTPQPGQSAMSLRITSLSCCRQGGGFQHLHVAQLQLSDSILLLVCCCAGKHDYI